MKENTPGKGDNSSSENDTPSIITPTRTLRSKSKKEEENSEDDKSSNNKNSQSPKRAQKRRISSKSKDENLSSSSPKAVKKEIDDNPTNEFNNDKNMFQLNIMYWPESWSHNKTTEYIEKECGCNEGCMSLEGVLTVSFDNEKQCLEAKDKLSKKVLEDNKLKVWIGDDKDDQNSEDEQSDITQPVRRVEEEEEEEQEEDEWKPAQDIWSKDPRGLYGLSHSFLKKLGINPPINQWVHVSNFRCDKSELKEVLELAGKVLVLTVTHAKTKYAKAMYSHPLEAVQAVSMFHGQTLYGLALQVSIDKCPVAASKLLPKGLAAIGPGLGIDGQPLRNVVKEFKRYYTDKENSINYKIFIDDDDYDVEYKQEEIKAEIDEIKNKTLDNSKKTTKNDQKSSKSSNVDHESDRESPDLNKSELWGSPCSHNDDVRSQTSESSGKINVINKYRSVPHQSFVRHSGPSNAGFSKPMNYSNNPGYRLNNMRPNPNFGPTMPGPGYNSVGPSCPMGPNGPMMPSVPMGPNGPMGANGPMGHTGQIGPRGPIGSNGQFIPGGQHGPMGPNVPHYGHARPVGPISGYVGPNRQMGPGPSGYSVPIVPTFRPSGPNNSFNHGRPGSTSLEPPVPGLSSKPGLLALRDPDSQTLHLRNVPEDMTFSMLSSRLAAIGSVMCLQMTAADSATVKFSNPSETEKCFKAINTM